MRVIQRMTLLIMNGYHKYYLMKYGICRGRMLMQTSPKIRVNYPLWMLTTLQELMEVSNIFFVGCWYSCAFGLHVLRYLIMHWKYFLLFWRQCLLPWVKFFPVVASFAVLFPKSVLYFASNGDGTKTDLLNMLCAQSVTLWTIWMTAMSLFTIKK